MSVVEPSADELTVTCVDIARNRKVRDAASIGERGTATEQEVHVAWTVSSVVTCRACAASKF